MALRLALRALALAAILAVISVTCPAYAAKDFDRTCRGAPVRLRYNDSAGVQEIPAFPAFFGGNVPQKPAAPLHLAIAEPAHACNTSHEPHSKRQWAGQALLAERGGCSFADKARTAQAGNATLLILYNDDETGCFGYLGASANETGIEGMQVQLVSVSREAGKRLIKVASEGGLVQQFIKHWSKLDPSELLLAVIAVGTLAGGAVWAGRDAVPAARAGSSSTGRSSSAALPSQEITAAMAALYFVFASGALMLLYFLIDYINVIMVGLFCLAATQSMALGLGTVLLDGAPSLGKERVTLPFLGDSVPLGYVISTTVALAASAVWAVFRAQDWAWMLQDALGMCLVMFFIRTLRLPSLKVAALLLSCMFVYDVWWVFIQPAVTSSESVMVTVATGGKSHEPIPMLFKAPSWHFKETGSYGMLGYGDVALPGLLAAFARIADLSLRKASVVSGYFLLAVVSYAVGLMLTYAALINSWFGDNGQPALLYLVPAMLIPMVLLAWTRSELLTLWYGDFSKQRVSTEDESVHLVADYNRTQCDHAAQEPPV